MTNGSAPANHDASGTDTTTRVFKHPETGEHIRMEKYSDGRISYTNLGKDPDTDTDLTDTDSDTDLTDTDSDTDDSDEGQWVPYIGDRGGEGWQNVDSGAVTYDDSPPGNALSPEEAIETTSLDAEAFDTIQTTVLDAVAEADTDVPLSDSDIMERVAADLLESAREDGVSLDDFAPDQIAQAAARGMVDTVREMEAHPDDTSSAQTGIEQVEEQLSEAGLDTGATDTLLTSISSKADTLNTDETAFAEAVARELESYDDFQAAVEQGDEAVIERAAQIAVEDVYQERLDDTPVRDLIDPELDEAITQSDHAELDKDGLSQAIEQSVDWDHDVKGELSGFGAPTSFEGVVETAQAHGITKPEIAEMVTDTFEEDLNPFADHSASVPDAFDPTESDVTVPFGMTDIGGGRSASSMAIAEGVPDETGEKRDLFVTNTNRSRGRAQDPADGERCAAGSEAFQAAGIPVARYINAQGEFWVAEDAGGVKASEARSHGIDHTDLDRPVEQFIDMMAVSMIVGASDFHGDNVHVDPDTGEIIPVDLDLCGEALHKDVRAFVENRYSFATQDGAIDRTNNRRNGFFNELGLDELADFDDVKDAIKRRSGQLAESGQAREIARAALDAQNNPTVTEHVEENVMRLESGDFWADGPPDTSGDMRDIREELGLPDTDAPPTGLEQKVKQAVNPGDIASMPEEEQAEADITDPEDERFTDYAGCIEYHSDKTDPESYCAVIFGFDEPDIEDEDDEYDEDDPDWLQELQTR